MGHESRLKGLLGLNPQAAPARARDHVGKVLEVGDEVVVVKANQHYRVAAIAPMLEAGAPSGLMRVTLVSKLQVAIPRDMSIEDVYALRHQAEIGDNLFKAEGQEPPPTPPEEPKRETVD